jgi:hypothetical protein
MLGAFPLLYMVSGFEAFGASPSGIGLGYFLHIYHRIGLHVHLTVSLDGGKDSV